ncbi:MAG: alpha/beta hydrolase [Deltaproteobacteria bacterium SG8_13]|nr:MAG: alpha/beta hydrolase [Deltaproteobacteria bacterium SG8_13]
MKRFRHLYPFDSHYLKRNGLRYHYLDQGSGDPVVMVHGNPTWSFYFRELVKALSPRFRTVVPDHIGCGLSDKPDTASYSYRAADRVADLEALLDHLQLQEKVTLVVHDWGGAIGLALAVKYPERFGRLVILNTAAFLPPHGKRLPWRLKIIRSVEPLAVPAVLGLNLFSRAALWMAARKKLTPEVRTGLTAPYNSWQNRLATLKFVQDIPVAESDPSYALVKHLDQRLSTLAHLPTLICWGAEDFVFDQDYLNEWLRRFPMAESHCFPGAGHYVLEDVPDKIVPLVADFLQRHPL